VVFRNFLMVSILSCQELCAQERLARDMLSETDKLHFGGNIWYQNGALLCSVVVSLTLPSGVFGTFITFSYGGDATQASIQGTVNSFRAALGDPNNGNAAGPLGSGRREINWDGGGAATTISATPFNGFQNIRGASFTTPGTGFIQAPLSGFDSTFSNQNLSSTFGVFSPQRIFSPISSNITDVSFFIPGTSGSDPATVSAFGAIFTDVDLAGSTSLQFYDLGNNLIFEQAVAPGTDSSKSFSFLGAAGNADEQIARVRITSGNTPITSTSVDTALLDIVAMDDFIYAEPKRVPETGGIGLIGLGLGSVLFFYRRSLAVS
jgi:hypothetical protein